MMDDHTPVRQRPGTGSTIGTEWSAQVRPSGDLRQLGPYAITGTLGWGGMGVVYRATDRRDQREVALKVIQAGGEASGDRLRRFEKEVEAVRGLDHPHIVKVHASGSDQTCHYCAMQLVEGRTLGQWADERERPIAERVRMLATIARAVDHAHAAGIIHRDLKPGNVIVAWERDHSYVADFGLARAIGSDSSLTKSEDAVGTPAYMAPEQARGEHRRCDARTDVWALGVMLYELLVGTQPFQGESALDAMAGIVNRDPAPPRSINPSIPPRIERVIMHCLRKPMAGRYRSAADLADDLERALAGHTVRAGRYGWIQRHRATLRRVAVPTLATVLAISLVAVVAVWQYRSHHQRWGRWVLAYGADFTRAGASVEGLTRLSPFLEALDRPPAIEPDGIHLAPRQWLFAPDLDLGGDVRVVARVRMPEVVDGIDLVVNAHLPEEPLRYEMVPSGYACQVGGYNGVLDFLSANATPRYPDTNLSRSSAVVPGGTHEIDLRREGATLTLAIDGEVRLRETFPIPLRGERLDRIGLRTWAEYLVVEELRVYRLAPGESASPLLAADTAARLGHPSVAHDEYLAVASAHRGTAVETRALTRALGNALGAEAVDEARVALLAEGIEAAPYDREHLQAARTALALHRWRQSEYERAFALIDRILAADGDSRVMGQCLGQGRPADDPAIRERIMERIGRSRGLATLSLSKLGVERLDALDGLHLRYLDLDGNPVSDLGPLRGMPLAYLNINHSQVTDLAPLRGMPLQRLSMFRVPVTDLSPLSDMPLIRLEMGRVPAGDLTPLRGMRLFALRIDDTPVEDLTPLRGMPLQHLNCTRTPVSDLSPIANPELRTLHAGGTGVDDLSPLAGLALHSLDISDSPVRSLAPLARDALHLVEATGCPLEDLGPLMEHPTDVFGFGHPDLDPDLLRRAQAAWLEAGRPELAAAARVHRLAQEDDVETLRHHATAIGGRRVLAVTLPLGWDAARERARAWGAELAAPASAEEAAAFRDLMLGGESYWIGLRYDPASGVRGLDGRPATFHDLHPDDSSTAIALGRRGWYHRDSTETPLWWLVAWRSDDPE